MTERTRHALKLLGYSDKAINQIDKGIQLPKELKPKNFLVGGKSPKWSKD